MENQNIIDQKLNKFSNSINEIINEIITIDYSIKENDKISLYLNNLLNKFASKITVLETFLNNISDDDISIIKESFINFLYLANPKNIIKFIPDDVKSKIAENFDLNTKSFYENIDCKLSLFPEELKSNVKDLLLEIKGKNVVDVLENNLGKLNDISDSAKKAIPYLDNFVNGNKIRLYFINEIKNFNYAEFKNFIIDVFKKIILDDNLKQLQNEINIIFGNAFYKDIRNVDDLLLYIFKYLQFGKHNTLTNFDVKVLIGIFSIPSLLFLINIPKSTNHYQYIINTVNPSFMVQNINWYTYLIICVQYFNILLIFLRVTFNAEIYTFIKKKVTNLNDLPVSNEMSYQIIKLLYMYNVKYLVGILYILGISLSLINFKNEESHNISIVRSFLTIFFIILIPELFFEKTLNSFSSDNYSLNILFKILTTLVVIYILDKSIVIITDSFKLYTNLGDKPICNSNSTNHTDYAESAKSAKYAEYADSAKYADNAKFAKYAENADHIVDTTQSRPFNKNKKYISTNTIITNEQSDTLLIIRFISIIIFAIILQQFNLNEYIQFNDNENINAFIQIIANVITLVICDSLFQIILIPLRINIKSTSKINVNYKLIVTFIMFLSLMLIGHQYSKKIEFVKMGDMNICIV